MKVKIHHFAFASMMIMGTSALAAEPSQKAADNNKQVSQEAAVLKQRPATAAGPVVSNQQQAELRIETHRSRIANSLDGGAAVYGAGL